jgi:hypothetical protein
MENKPNNNSIIETYSKDMVKVLEENKDGLIKKIIKQEEEREFEHKNYSPVSTQNKIFIFVSIFLLLSGVFGVVYINLKKEAKSVQITPQFTPPIFLDKTEFLDVEKLNKEAISKGLFDYTQTINKKVKSGGVLGVYLTKNKKVVEFEAFMKSLEGNLDKKAYEFIDKNFLFGVVNTEGSISSVIEKEEKKVIEEKKVEEPKKKIVEEAKDVSLNISSLFKTGTVEFIDDAKEDEAKQSLLKFLSDVDFITSKIKVVGTYSVERPWEKNDFIAEERRVKGVNILNEVLKENFTQEEIDKVTIESQVKGLSIKDIYTEDEIKEMTKEEKELAIDKTQGVNYLIEAKTKPKQTEQAEEEIKTQEESTESIKQTKILSQNYGDPFLFIKIRSFTDIFPFMSAWENKLFLDLHGIFGLSITPDTSYLLTKNWKSGIVQNKNARILYDKDENIVMMYVYVDDTTVVITDSNSSAREIIKRLSSSKVRK